MQPKGTDPETMNSLNTLFSVLDGLKEHERIGVTDLAEATGIAKSTVHRYLQTLEHHGYVSNERGIYRLTYRFLEFGGIVRMRNPYFDEITEKVDYLAAETGEHVHYFIEENGAGVSVYKKRGSHAIRTDSHVGQRFDLHHIAAGKAMLSAFSDQQVQRTVELRGLEALTANTIVDEESLLAELATCRQRGYAINDREVVDTIKAVGVPLVLQNDGLVGAISISGPATRFDDDRIENELAPLLQGVQNELQINLGFL